MNGKNIKVGICGAGAFASSFIPLFKAHPGVTQIILCDLDTVKLDEKADRFDVSETCLSLDQLCQTDVDAIAIFTQHHLHGPQAVQTLKSGKHVHLAVPPAISLQEITELVRAVEQTGKITCLVKPATITHVSSIAENDLTVGVSVISSMRRQSTITIIHTDYMRLPDGVTGQIGKSTMEHHPCFILPTPSAWSSL